MERFAMSHLGNKLADIKLSYGLLSVIGAAVGKTPAKAVEVYENGIVLKKKQGDESYSFSEISRIKQVDYFAPNPNSILVELFVADGRRVATMPIYNKQDVTALLAAHRDFQLGPDFPANLEKLDIDLGGLLGELRLKDGQLIQNYKGETRAVAITKVEDFTHNKVMYAFKIKDEKHTLAVDINKAPNCLTSIAVGEAVVRKARQGD